MFCPMCDGFLLWSSLKALASPLQGPLITVKCFLPHRRPLLPALLWIWLLRNGCRDCKSRHMVALPWQTKKGWKRKKKQMAWFWFKNVTGDIQSAVFNYLIWSWVLLSAAAEGAAPDVVPQLFDQFRVLLLDLLRKLLPSVKKKQ